MLRSKLPIFYANSEILAKYMKRLVLSESQYFALCTIIDSAINNINNNRAPTHFIDDLLDVLKNIDTSAQAYCLHSIKEYLHSRDFNYPGKYISSSWFFGSITHTKESQKLQPLDQKLDKAINKLGRTPESNKTVLKPQASFAQTLSAAIDSACDYTIAHPFQAFTYVLFLQTSFTSAAKNNAVQCPVKMDSNPLQLDSNMVCEPLDILRVYYRVIANAPLHEVTHFAMVEEHNNQTHFDIRSYVLPQIVRKGDAGLFEGIESMTVRPCGQMGKNNYGMDVDIATDALLCVGADSEEIISSIIEKGNKYKAFEKNWEEIVKVHTAIVTSLNAMEAAHAINFEKIQTALEDIFIKLKTFNVFLKEYNLKPFPMKKMLRYKDNIIKASQLNRLDRDALGNILLGITNHLDKIYPSISKIAETLFDDEIIIKQRNEVIMQTANKLERYFLQQDTKKTTHRYFLFTGMVHVIAEEQALKQSSDDNEFMKITDNDPQKEYRDFLDEKKSAILIPK